MGLKVKIFPIVLTLCPLSMDMYCEIDLFFRVVGYIVAIFQVLVDIENIPKSFTVHSCMLSHLSPVQLFETPWTVAHQAPLSLEFSRQEYWSGLPFLSPGKLSNPGIEPRPPTLWADSLPSEHSSSKIAKTLTCCHDQIHGQFRL